MWQWQRRVGISVSASIGVSASAMSVSTGQRQQQTEPAASAPLLPSPPPPNLIHPLYDVKRHRFYNAAVAVSKLLPVLVSLSSGISVSTEILP